MVSLRSGLRLVFCGTPEFAVPSLRALIGAGHSIDLVLVQPDRPQGRGLELTVPPVKQTALELGFNVIQPTKLKINPELEQQLRAINPDAIVVVAYGRILPPWLLAAARFGCINVHGSLLPKYRGAAPIQWAIANGESETGVTTMRLDEGLDTGEMLLARSTGIGAKETSLDLFPRLAVLGAELLIETLDGLADGSLQPTKQENSRATLAPLLVRDDGRIDFARTALETFNRWRGFQPWPGAFSSFRSKKIILHSIHPAAAEFLAAHAAHLVHPGTLLMEGENLFLVCAQSTALEITELQLEGKNKLSAARFLHGYQLRSGERLA